MKNIALVGTGIGREHLQAFADLPELYRVAAVCDLNVDATRELAAQHDARPTTDFASVLADDDIEIVDLCTPPWLHEQQTIEALAAGKHVVCEKPLAGSLAAIDRIESAADQAGRTVFPVFNYRYGPSFQQFLGLVDSGVLGAPLVSTIEVGFLRGAGYYANGWRGTKTGELGGCLASHAIHHFDMLLTALGRPTTAMALTATRVNDIETEDCAAGAIGFADGAMASFAVTLGCVEQYSRLRLVFTDAVAEFGPGPYDSMTEGAWSLYGVEQPAVAAGEPGFVAMFREIHSTLGGTTNNAPTLAEARATLELVTAMYQAAAEGASAEIPIPPTSEWYERWA